MFTGSTKAEKACIRKKQVEDLQVSLIRGGDTMPLFWDPLGPFALHSAIDQHSLIMHCLEHRCLFGLVACLAGANQGNVHERIRRNSKLVHYRKHIKGPIGLVALYTCDDQRTVC